MIEALPPVVEPLRHALDVILVAILVYFVVDLVRGTLAAQAIKGLALLAVVAVAAQVLRLETFNWIVERLGPVFLLGLVVIFQPELRRGLARIGARPFGNFLALEMVRVLDEVVRAATELSQRRWGALIAIEKETGLQTYIETGTLVQAEVTTEILTTIFTPRSTLHDGAVIISGHSVVAAGCILPLATDAALDAQYGTRHRAAIGLSRETDACVVVVSEETGRISFAVGGRLVPHVDEDSLRNLLHRHLAQAPKESDRGLRLLGGDGWTLGKTLSFVAAFAVWLWVVILRK